MKTAQGSGLWIASLTYILWGITPIYFKWVAHENSIDVVANRILWSVILLAIVITGMGKWTQVKTAFSSFKTLKTLLFTTAFIATNWLTFIYAVNSNHMLDASLGYYINPFVSVVLAYFFLGERLNRIQIIALVLALIGVSIQIFSVGYLPWISIVLALSFGFYGLLHKKTSTDSFTSLFIETSLLLPFALLFMGYLYQTGSGPATREVSGWFLLMLSGPATTIPLLLFSIAAKKISLSTMGFLQYLAPSMVLLLAVFIYGETLTMDKAITFMFIWAGLACYIFDTLRRRSKANRAIS